MTRRFTALVAVLALVASMFATNVAAYESGEWVTVHMVGTQGCMEFSGTAEELHAEGLLYFDEESSAFGLRAGVLDGPCPIVGPEQVAPVAPYLVPATVCWIEDDVVIPAQPEGVLYDVFYGNAYISVTFWPAEGWYFPDGTQTFWEFNLSVLECDTEVIPPDPWVDFTYACGENPGLVVVPGAYGVIWHPVPPPTPDGIVVVTAEPEVGFVFPPGFVAVWELNVLSDEDCPDPEPTPTEEPTTTPDPSPTATATPDPSPTATATPDPSPTATATPDPSPTVTPDPTPTEEPGDGEGNNGEDNGDTGGNGDSQTPVPPAPPKGDGNDSDSGPNTTTVKAPAPTPAVVTAPPNTGSGTSVTTTVSAAAILVVAGAFLALATGSLSYRRWA